MERDPRDQKAGVTYTRDTGCIVARVPIDLMRREGRKRIVTPATPSVSSVRPPPATPQRNHSLCLAIARAHRWRDLIENGEVSSIPRLAETFDVDGAYIRRTLRLTLLAPDIIDAILAGNEPPGLSLEQLRRFPVSWTEQREHFAGREEPHTS